MQSLLHWQPWNAIQEVWKDKQLTSYFFLKQSSKSAAYIYIKEKE